MTKSKPVPNATDAQIRGDMKAMLKRCFELSDRAPAGRGTIMSNNDGTIIKWDDERGFGFLASDSGGDVFVHISAFNDSGLREPQVGDRYTFTIAPGRGGRFQAIDLRPACD